MTFLFGRKADKRSLAHKIDSVAQYVHHMVGNSDQETDLELQNVGSSQVDLSSEVEVGEEEPHQQPQREQHLEQYFDQQRHLEQQSVLLEQPHFEPPEHHSKRPQFLQRDHESEWPHVQHSQREFEQPNFQNLVQPCTERSPLSTSFSHRQTYSPAQQLHSPSQQSQLSNFLQCMARFGGPVALMRFILSSWWRTVLFLLVAGALLYQYPGILLRFLCALERILVGDDRFELCQLQ